MHQNDTPKCLHASFSSATFCNVTPNGTAIREIRKLRGMGVRTVATAAGLHHTHLSRLERGQAGVSEANLRTIADVLGVPVAAINREETP